MELHQNLNLIYDVNAVLRGQGADPEILRARRPRLVEVAEKARLDSIALLTPRVFYREFAIEGIKHERLLLEGGRKIDSKLLVQQLAGASRLIVLLATIGEELEQRVTKIWDADMVYALALDGAGSASVEALANAACLYFDQQAADAGLRTSVPFSPGMLDWSVSDGQPQIFELLGEEESIVHLTSSYIMIPQKSLTMVKGIGSNLDSYGRTCDFCTMRGSCKYQDHYTSK
jgi:hypothetical protein